MTQHIWIIDWQNTIPVTHTQLPFLACLCCVQHEHEINFGVTMHIGERIRNMDDLNTDSRCAIYDLS